MLQIRSYVAGPLGNNGYLIADAASGETLVIDCPLASRPAADQLASLGVKVTAILVTHGHFDHTAEAAHWHEKTGAPVYLHPADAEWAEGGPRNSKMFGLSVPPFPRWQPVIGGQEFKLGGTVLRVIHTPGHTQGGLCLLIPDDGAGGAHLFTGDTLFAGSIGRTDLPGGDTAQLLGSIREKLLPLADATRVYPGHGPASTIGEERLDNPFLGANANGFVQIK